MLLKLLLPCIAVLLACTSLAAQWTAVPTPFSATHISATDSNSVWVESSLFNGSWVGVTNDGGTTWTASEVSYPAGYQHVSDLMAIDSNCWMVVTGIINLPWGGGSYPSGKVFRFSDGDTVWQQVFGARELCAIGFFTSSEGLLIGKQDSGSFKQYTTLDGGNSWSGASPINILPITSSENPLDGSLKIIGNNAWFSTSGNRIFRTQNKGVSWSAFQVAGTIKSFAFKDGFNGLLLTDSQLFRTQDGGITWNVVAISGALPNALSVVPLTGVYHAGNSFSVNDGQSWTAVPFSGSADYGFVQFINNRNGWALASGLKRYNGPGYALSAPGGLQPQTITLYPNPTTGNLFIKDSSNPEGTKNAQVKIYDLFGRLLVHHTTYSSINLSGFKPGIYMAEIHCGAFINTQKILLW